ncbi:integrase [Mesorhizobium sp. CN2-181]|uniref:integrase n=1 Tax=Mesorhizobium yinganensis TaxID=3157707 RepID=UPI0032B86BE3
MAAGLHWRTLDPEVHLGYRKGKSGGVWLVRWRTALGYNRAQLGTADDVVVAGTLDYEAARRAARDYVNKLRDDAEAAKQKAQLEAAGKPITVADAVEQYIASRDARDTKRKGRVVRSDASQRLTKYLLGQPVKGKRKARAPAPIASVELFALAEADLSKWRAGLPGDMAGATRQRLINDVKAALNAAFADNRQVLPLTLPAVVKHGLRADAREDEAEPVARDNQILGDGCVARLIRASREIDAEDGWEGDLFRLVTVLAATGARFSQVIRVRVSGCQLSAGRLMIPVSRKGRGGKSGDTPVPVGRDVLDELVSVAHGRKGDPALLERWRYKQVAATAWEPIGRGPWQAASELARPWKSIRDRAGLPEAIPYALRHSSIVRGIRQNLPIRLVAALHDTSVEMIERHYAKWITSGLEDMARAAIVPLVSAPQADVVTLRRGA